MFASVIDTLGLVVLEAMPAFLAVAAGGRRYHSRDGRKARLSPLARRGARQSVERLSPDGGSRDS